MRIFVYEHFTSGALAGADCPPGLTHEGDAMLAAIVQDLLALSQPLQIMRDLRLPKLEVSDNAGLLQTRWINSQDDYHCGWQDCLQQNDYVLIIAPETDDVLLDLAQQVQQQRKHFLGSDLDTLALCSNKLRCYQQLHHHEVLTPVTQTAADWLQQPVTESELWIIKPIDGAGCEQTYLLTAEQVQAKLTKLTTTEQQRLIVQPFIDGQALSLSLFISADEIELLSINIQHFEQTHQQLHLNRCEVSVNSILAQEAAMALARQVHATLPGLWGFIGIDLIKNGEQLWVIEVNPRLTSSYAEADMRRARNPALALQRYLSSTAIRFST